MKATVLLVCLLLVRSIFAESLDIKKFKNLHSKNIFSNQDISKTASDSNDVKSSINNVINEKNNHSTILEPTISYHLVGVLIEKNQTHLFLVNQSKNLQIFKLNERIDDLIFKSASVSEVIVQNNDLEFVLPVGSSIEKIENQTWKINHDKKEPMPINVSSNTKTSSIANDQAEVNTPSTLNSKQQELLMRLKSRRTKELK